MIKKSLAPVKVSGPAGGQGDAYFTYILEGEELPKNSSLMSFIELEPGTCVGYHKHEKNSEMYYIMEGEGEYTENGGVCTVSPGMVTMVYAGESHGLKNTGSGKLKMLAVIVED